MLAAPLGDFKAHIGGIHYALVHAVNLVSEDQGVFFSLLRSKLLQAYGIESLLDADYPIAFTPESGDSLQCGPVMLPGHAQFRPDGRFVDFRRRRDGADTAKAQQINLEGVTSPENAAYIVGAAYIVKHYNQP